MATNLLDWCTKRRVSLTAKFLPGKLNVLVDSLSRKGQIIHTVDPSQGHSVAAISFLGSPSHRPVCHEAEQSTSDFHFSLSRPVSMGSGRHVPVMGRNDSIYIHSHPISDEGLAENGETNLPVILIAPCWESHPFFPVLLSLMVAPAVRLPIRKDLLIQPHSRLPHPKPGNLQPASLALLQGGFEKAGFSKQSAERVCAAKRASTQSLYNYVGTLGWISVSSGRWIPSIRL